MKVLEVAGLQTFYRKSHMLRGISLEVGEAETMTLLGRDGRGKPRPCAADQPTWERSMARLQR